MLDLGHQACREGQPADEVRTKDDAGQDLADYPGLAQPDEDVAEELGEPDEQQEQEQDRSEVGVRDGGLSGRSGDRCSPPQAGVAG